MPEETEAWQVQVRGLLRGRELNDQATLSLNADSLNFRWAHASSWSLALNGIDGLYAEKDMLTVYLQDHDLLEFRVEPHSAASLRSLEAAVLARACKVPELMHGSRLELSRHARFASTPGDPERNAHSFWLAPLVEGRRAIEGVSDPERQAAVLNSDRTAQAMLAAIGKIAELLAPGDAATQRALGAAMQDESAAMFSALDRMNATARTLAGSSPDTRIADWRRWMASVGDAYAAAGEAWTAIRELLFSGQ